MTGRSPLLPSESTVAAIPYQANGNGASRHQKPGFLAFTKKLKSTYPSAILYQNGSIIQIDDLSLLLLLAFTFY